MSEFKKDLGQHWLHDRAILQSIADFAAINSQTTVLEIGPGLGTLTSVLLKDAKEVVAVEFDPELARKLPSQFPGKALRVIHQDILEFDLGPLPKDYTVVANVPYYITSKIVKLLLESSNPPKKAVLLVQKEVAERLAAKPDNMSVLAVSAQVYADVTLGDVVPAAAFIPPPKVDSRVVCLRRRPKSQFSGVSAKVLFKVVKAGFSAKRKKLRSSLAGGLGLDKQVVEDLLQQASLDPNRRAETLSIAEWTTLAHLLNKNANN